MSFVLSKVIFESQNGRLIKETGVFEASIGSTCLFYLQGGPDFLSDAAYKSKVHLAKGPPELLFIFFVQANLDFFLKFCPRERAHRQLVKLGTRRQ